MATVTAVIPVFNAANLIGAALNSVRDQTRRPDEIIVADDASTDGTVEVVQVWAQVVGLPCRVVRLDKNGGAAAARNAGILAARSDFVAMLDADDVWLPNMIERLAGELETVADAVLAFGMREFFNDSGAMGEYQGADRIARQLGPIKLGTSKIVGSQDTFLLNVASAVTSCSASVVRRQAALDCGLFDPDFRTSQDREFVLRLSRRGAFVFVNEPVSLYRLHEANTTHSRNAVRNALNGLLVLDKIYRQKAHLPLTSTEVIATRAAMDRAARSLLYLASTRGLKSYVRTRADLRNTEVSLGVLDLRSMVRACWRSFFVDRSAH